MTAHIADLRCHACDSSDVVLIKPGTDPVTAPGGIVIDQGEPTTATCLACWKPAPGYQQTLFGDYPG